MEDSLQIGVNRPALPLDDLLTPEEVFKVPKLGRAEVWKFVLGPSMIALGTSIGSGEWLLGPLAFGKYGFIVNRLALTPAISEEITKFYLRQSDARQPV